MMIGRGLFAGGAQGYGTYFDLVFQLAATLPEGAQDGPSPPRCHFSGSEWMMNWGR
jgi:hypothetical protein